MGEILKDGESWEPDDEDEPEFDALSAHRNAIELMGSALDAMRKSIFRLYLLVGLGLIFEVLLRLA